MQERRLERILLLLFLVTVPLLNPWVRGDGVGYYAYARAPLIEHNLDFTHDYQSANDSFRESRCDENGQPRPEFRTRTGHLDNHFTVGPAMLWSPFLLLAHGGVLLARALGSNCCSGRFFRSVSLCHGPWHRLIRISGSVALISSVAQIRGPVWSFLATLAIWWGSSLPVYMYFNPAWSHAHSAFVVRSFSVVLGCHERGPEPGAVATLGPDRRSDA